MKIRKLDSYTISRIAAGEVIDRPVSIVKELVENSIDAGSSKIVIDVQKGGLAGLSVSDNGTGIDIDDLAVALEDHATSKILKMEDLYALDSMGFRGEALASIRQVASIELISRPPSQSVAGRVMGSHRGIESAIPTQRSQGTTVVVSDLFHSMPVRQKFLKTAATEFGYIFELIVGFVLLYPSIEFVLSHDGKQQLNTTGIYSPQQRIGLIWGRDLSEQLLSVHFSVGDFLIQGWISRPSFTVSNRSKIVLAVNSRIVKNPVLQKAISQAVADSIPSGRYPAVVLDIQVPSDQIDVNIHPQKQDVRFVNTGFVFDLIVKGLRSTIGHHQSAVTVPTSTSHVPQFGQPLTVLDPSHNRSIEPQMDVLFRAIDWSTHQTPSISHSTLDPHLPFQYLQLFETYLALNAGDALVLIDQHAVHERILYEEFKVQSEALTYQQPLLVSHVISLEYHQIARLNELMTALKGLGFEVEIFGDSQLVVRQVPVSLAGPTAESTITAFVRELSDLDSGAWDQILLDKDRLQRMACRAAIKAGKRMHQSEVDQMVRVLIQTPNQYTCPHGRPLVLVFYKKDLERLFHRI